MPCEAVAVVVLVLELLVVEMDVVKVVLVVTVLVMLVLLVLVEVLLVEVLLLEEEVTSRCHRSTAHSTHAGLRTEVVVCVVLGVTKKQITM